MTLATTVNKAGPIEGNGVNKTFNFTFRVDNADDLDIIYTDAAGVETTIVADFTVTGLGNDNGGSVTYPAAGSAIAASTFITLVRTVELTQETELPDQGAYLASVVEAAFDRLMMAIQQVNEATGRSLKLPLSASASTELPLPSAGMGIGWNGAADGLTNLASLGAVAVPVPLAAGGTGVAAASASQALAGLGVDAALHAALAAASTAAFLTAIGAQAADADTLKSDVSATLSVGMVHALHDHGAYGTHAGAISLDLADGLQQKVVVDSNGLTITAPNNSGVGGYLELLIEIDSVATPTVSFVGFENYITGVVDNGDNALNLLRISRIDGKDVYDVVNLEAAP